MASASILTEKAPGKPVPTLSVLAVSGPDNVGKSTQLRILARRIGPCAALAGSLDAYDPRWRTITALGMADWWFDQASIEEVADVLACSYLERARQAPSSGLRLVDRGIPMLEASVAATAAAREELSSDAAEERARSILAAYDPDIREAESAEHSVVLLHQDDLDAGIAESLAREPSVSPVYAAYERHLHVQLGRLIAEGRFGARIVTAGSRRLFLVESGRILRSVTFRLFRLVGLSQLWKFCAHDVHCLLFQDWHFLLAYLPHDRPVDTEVLMHRNVTECPDMPPGNVRIPISQRIRERTNDLAQQKQPVQDKASRSTRFSSHCSRLMPARYSRTARVLSTRSATYSSSRRIQNLRVRENLIPDDPVQPFLRD